MKALVSDRFSLLQEGALSHLRPKQLAYRDKVKRALGHEFKLIPNKCPCLKGDSSSDVIIAEKDRYDLPLQSLLCLKCGTVRIDPYLSPESLADFYKDCYQEMYGRDLDLGKYFERQRQYGAKFYDLVKDTIRKPANVLEFGCGAGGALTIFKERGHHVYGTEYSPKMINYGKECGLDNLYAGSIDDFKNNAGNLKFDLIYSNHVFEHVNKPFDCLKICIELMKDDGCVICAIPDIYNIDSPEYSFPNNDLQPMLHIAHIYNYSFECLESVAKTLHVNIERLHPDRNMITPTSVMPEIWFRIFKGQATANTGSTGKPADYLNYFRNTEENFKKIVRPKMETSLLVKIKEKIKQLLHWKR